MNKRIGKFMSSTSGLSVGGTREQPMMIEKPPIMPAYRANPPGTLRVICKPAWEG